MKERRHCVNCKWWEIEEDNVKEREWLQDKVDSISDKDLLKKILAQEVFKKKLNAGYCYRFPPVIDCNDKKSWYAIFPRISWSGHCGEFQYDQNDKWSKMFGLGRNNG